MNAFSNRPFAAGALTGIRSFRVAAGGRLTGIWHKHDFTPGENTADCCVRHSGAFAMTVCGMTRRPPANHRPGALDCTCGYYAYFDRGNNPYHGAGQVLALIEGYGLMSVGQRGFRCEKARLVAFIDEAVPTARNQVPAVTVGRWAMQKAAGLLRLGPIQWESTTIPWQVRVAYPDVPVFRGVDATLAVHPLTVPERPREDAA